MKTSIDLINEDKYLQELHKRIDYVYEVSEFKLIVKDGEVKYIYPEYTLKLVKKIKKLIHERLIQLTK